jgi:hypothetical protein
MASAGALLLGAGGDEEETDHTFLARVQNGQPVTRGDLVCRNPALSAHIKSFFGPPRRDSIFAAELAFTLADELALPEVLLLASCCQEGFFIRPEFGEGERLTEPV